MKHRIVLATIWLAVSGSTIAQTTRLVPSQYPTIQFAINACANGDTVTVAPGFYPGAISFLGKAINVHSSGGAAVTTITGTPSSAVVSLVTNEGPTSILDGFTVTGGNGGVLIQNASPSIQNCLIVNNVATNNGGWGGGIRCTATGTGLASPTIANCIINGNIASGTYQVAGAAGGGISFDGSSTATSFPTLTGCALESNFAVHPQQYQGSGGGINVGGANYSPTFVSCVIRDNLTSGNGGGVNAGVVSGSFVRCQIMNNHTPISGGGLNISGSISLVGCLIANNTCGTGLVGPDGAGVSISLGNSTAGSIQSCTIVGNTSANFTGGIFANLSGTAQLTVINSIAWGNSGINLNTTSGTITYSDVGFGLYSPGVGTINADPEFADATNGDYHLSTTSPCRNAGAPGTLGLPATDLDGGARIVGGIVDMGSDEVPALAFPGTPDGLNLYARINGSGDPLASTRTGAPGNLLTVRMASPDGALVGGLPVFAGRMYFTGNQFPVPGGGSGIWLDGQAIIVYGMISAPPFGFPGLPPGGLAFNFIVPPGLGGMTVRMQGFVSSATAVNGMYASTNATEVTF